MVPTVWAAAITAFLGLALADLSWPFVDLYSFLYRASAFTWRETIVNAFSGSVEYRPLMIIGVKLAHQVVGLRLALNLLDTAPAIHDRPGAARVQRAAGRVEGRHVVALEAQRPARGAVEADDVAVVADDRERLPGLDVQRQSGEHLVVTVGIVKAHVLERDTATPGLDEWLQRLDELPRHRDLSGAEVIQAVRDKLP